MDIKQHMTFEDLYLTKPQLTEPQLTDPKKKSIYFAYNLRDAVNFIRLNTNWKQVGRLEFINGNEHINLVNNIDLLGYIKCDNIYLDYSINNFNVMNRAEIVNLLRQRTYSTKITITDNKR